MKRTFKQKGYGRIYADKEKDIATVKKIIKELDRFEFDYLPADLIVPFSEYPAVVSVGKFEADLNLLTATCWRRGIKIWVLDNKMDDWVSNAAPPESSK